MLKSYLISAIRSMKRQKFYSAINLFGLAVGIAACVLILLYVQYELSYDKYLKDHDRIYRISRLWLNADGKVNLHLGHLAPPFSPYLKMDFEGTIEESVRLINTDPLIKSGDKHFVEDRFFFADPELFNVFSWKMIKGDPATALAEPMSVVLTESTARKYFGDAEPMGQMLEYDQMGEMKVTGIVKDIPENSHLHPSMFAPMALVEQFYGGNDQFMSAWGSNNFSTFVKFKNGVDLKSFEEKLPGFIDKHLGSGNTGKASDTNQLQLMNITDIHLHSHLDSEIEENGDIAYIYLFTIIAIFILAIACINYINLATAKSANRAREVGIRKTLGAYRGRLIGQFLTESMIYTILAMVLAWLLVSLLLPWFNNFSQKSLELNILNNPFLLIMLLGITVLTGLVAGTYPAIYLSAFEPAQVLKGPRKKAGKSTMRSALVIFQFFVSIVMLIGVFVVSDQLAYVKNKDLGFGKNRVLVLPTSNEIHSKFELVKNQLLAYKGINSVGFSSRIPSGRLLDSQGGSVEVDGNMKNLDFRLADVNTDFDFLSTMEIPIVSGRDFNKELSSDSTEAFIINEAAVRAIGYKGNDNAIGKKISYGGRNGYIIGVVKDFHFESLKQQISPIVFLVSQDPQGSFVLKLDENQQETTMKYLQEQWSYLNPGRPFSYYFVDARFNELYQADEKTADLVSYFSIIAVIIGVLGLMGLAMFTTEQRVKEIGVRKVFGASVPEILVLLSKSFTILVLVAFVLAIPVSLWGMNLWLDTFAYHAKINPLSILFAGGVAIIVAWLSVGMQTYKAASANPIDSLKEE